MEYKQALEIASRLVERLEPYCERVAIAGSVRRKRPEVKDIEIVALPKLQQATNLFGEAVKTYDLLDGVSGLGRFIKSGPKYKQIALPEGINLDLFCVIPPAQWGYLFAIRTGPAEFSKRLVTARKFRGWLPSHAKPVDGVIMSGKRIIEMPEEQDLFGFCGLPFVKPEDRDAYLEAYKAGKVYG